MPNSPGKGKDKEDAGREFFANFWASNIVPRSVHVMHALIQGLVSVYFLLSQGQMPLTQAHN